jgi:hypothetical protein
MDFRKVTPDTINYKRRKLLIGESKKYVILRISN